MRTTGIVRRIDDLGRIAIPKEIRRRIGVHEGDPLEIYVEGKDTVCFRKYNNNLSNEIASLRDQVETSLDLSPEAQERILILLDDVCDLINGEE